VAQAAKAPPLPPIGGEIEIGGNDSCCEGGVSPTPISEYGEDCETMNDHDVHDFLQDAFKDFDPKEANILDVCT